MCWAGMEESAVVQYRLDALGDPEKPTVASVELPIFDP